MVSGSSLIASSQSRTRTITHHDSVAALTCALGRDFTFGHHAGGLRRKPARIQPPWQAAGLREDHAHYRRGEAGSGDRDGRRHYRPAPRHIGRLARDYAAALGRATRAVARPGRVSER